MLAFNIGVAFSPTNMVFLITRFLSAMTTISLYTTAYVFGVLFKLVSFLSCIYSLKIGTGNFGRKY